MTTARAWIRSDLQDNDYFLPPTAGAFGSQGVKADSNENPYACVPEAREALAHVSPHLYPDATYTALRRELAAYCGVEQGQIVLGNGGDEVIDLVLRAALEPGEGVVNFTPTFSMYEFFIRLNRGKVVEIPRPDDFSVPVAEALRRLDERTKAIMVCAPNNPTGNLPPLSDILTLLDTGRLVMVDETYFEFCGHTVTPLIATYPNLVVVRTLSKWAGLAGMRVGYAILHEEFGRVLDGIRAAYNVNVAAEAAALASLRQREVALANARKIVAERERLFAALQGVPFLRVLPSQTNFLLGFVLEGEMAALRRQLEDAGVYLRWFSGARLARATRISIGRPEDSDRLLAALREWRT